MSTELDLDDVAATSPLAAAELADLYATAARLALERAEFRRERDEARKDAASCAAAHINAVAQLTEARRLLDDARAQKPVGDYGVDGKRVPLYAAPVPAKPAFPYTIAHLEDICDPKGNKWRDLVLAQPAAVPEAVAKNAVCPKCGEPEIDAMTPLTVYACESADLDQRPGTFKQSKRCAALLSAADAEVKNG